MNANRKPAKPTPGSGDPSPARDATGAAAAAEQPGGCSEDVAFDAGMATELDFGKPAPRHEGDNAIEKRTAREAGERKLPPRARPRER